MKDKIEFLSKAIKDILRNRILPLNPGDIVKEKASGLSYTVKEVSISLIHCTHGHTNIRIMFFLSRQYGQTIEIKPRLLVKNFTDENGKELV